MFARHFRRAVLGVRLSGLAEQVWHRAAPAVGTLSATFLTASWLGLWQHVSPSVRMTGVALFAVALAAAVAPLAKVRVPSRRAALNRLDENTGLPNKPATTYSDIPAGAGGNREEEMIWDLQRRRIERQVGKFSSGAPDLGLKDRDPLKLRYVLPLATALSFGFALMQGEETERIARAFDWKPEVIVNHAKVDAWITPPDYTGQKPVALSSRGQGPVPGSAEGVSVPANSILTLRVHERDARIEIKGGATPVNEACQILPGDGTTRCAFTLAADAGLTVYRRGGRDVSWSVTVTPDRPPVITARPAQGDKDGAGADVIYKIEDEYEATPTDGRIIPADPQDPEAQKLPLYRQPWIRVPVK